MIFLYNMPLALVKAANGRQHANIPSKSKWPVIVCDVQCFRRVERNYWPSRQLGWWYAANQMDPLANGMGTSAKVLPVKRPPVPDPAPLTWSHGDPPQ